MENKKNKNNKKEKKEHQNITMLPSLKKKVIKRSVEVMGSANFSGYISLLAIKDINEKH